MNITDQYNRDGYVVIPQAVSRLMVEQAITDIQIMTHDKNNRIDYIQSLASASKLSSVYDLFRNTNLASALKEIGFGKTLIHGPVVHIVKSERLSDLWYETVAHQDWPSMQSSLDMVAMWIPLTECKNGNFPLEVIPKSHLMGLNEGEINGGVLEIECEDKDFIPVECNIGDAVIFSGFLIHRTGKGDGYRVAASQRFDNADEPTFVERGYPCAQTRVVDREVEWKPTVGQVRDIYA